MPGGKVAQVDDPIPEVTQWDYPTIIAHLNLGWIRWANEAASKIEALPKAQEAVQESAKNTFCSPCNRTFSSLSGLSSHNRHAHRVQGG